MTVTKEELLLSNSTIDELGDLLSDEYERLKERNDFCEHAPILANSRESLMKTNYDYNKAHLEKRAPKQSPPQSKMTLRSNSLKKKKGNPISVQEIQNINKQNIQNGKYDNTTLPTIAKVRDIQMLFKNVKVKRLEQNSELSLISNSPEGVSQENIRRLCPFTSRMIDTNNQPTFNFNPYSKNIKSRPNNFTSFEFENLQISSDEKNVTKGLSNETRSSTSSPTIFTSTHLTNESLATSKTVSSLVPKYFITVMEDNLQTAKPLVEVNSTQVQYLYDLEHKMLEEKEKQLDIKEENLKIKEKVVKNKEVKYDGRNINVGSKRNFLLNDCNVITEEVEEVLGEEEVNLQSILVDKVRIIEAIEPKQISNSSSPFSIADYYMDEPKIVSQKPKRKQKNTTIQKSPLQSVNTKKLQEENQTLLHQNKNLADQLESLSETELQKLSDSNNNLQRNKVLLQMIALKKTVAILNKQIIEEKLKNVKLQE